MFRWLKCWWRGRHRWILQDRFIVTPQGVCSIERNFACLCGAEKDYLPWE